MKQDKQQVGELLNKLVKTASRWQRILEGDDSKEIDQAIAEFSPLELASLDLRARRCTGYGWSSLRASHVSRLARSKFASSLVGLASFHFNGYVREAAVNKLASQRTGKEVSFLLIRLNDWVPQVREAAAAAVRERINPFYAPHLLANIPLVLRLRDYSRLNKSLVDDIWNSLKLPEFRMALQSGTKSKDKRVRRICFQLIAEAEPSSHAAIIRAIMNDPEAPMRRFAIQLLPEVAPQELADIIGPMLRDRFMPVRRDALWFAAIHQPDIAKEPLRDALLDGHASMRETARQFLKIAEVESAREFYSEAIQSSSSTQLAAAIRGLGETGAATDAPLLTPFLDSELARVRRAAVYALGKLDLEGQFQRLLTMLSDRQSGVSREALKVLQRKASFIPLVAIEGLVFGKADLHVRRNALTLISDAGKWKKLPALLQACCDENPKIARQASTTLQAWWTKYNCSFAEPTLEDFQKISVALKKFEACLPSGFDAELHACLKDYFK